MFSVLADGFAFLDDLEILERFRGGERSILALVPVSDIEPFLFLLFCLACDGAEVLAEREDALLRDREGPFIIEVIELISIRHPLQNEILLSIIVNTV